MQTHSNIRIGLVLNIYSVLLAVLPIVIVVGLALNLFGQQARDQAVNQMTAMAEAKNQEIRRWLENSEITLSLILTNPEQYRRMGDILLSRGLAGPRGVNVTNFLTDQLALQNSFEELYLYDSEGEIRISTDDLQVGETVKLQPYFSLSLKQPAIQAPYYDFKRGHLTSIVSQPIYHTSGSIIGVLAGRLNLTTLSNIMTTRGGLGETAEMYLVSKESHNFITPSRFEPYNPTVSYQSYGIDNALNGVQGVAFYNNYQGKAVIGVHRWLPELQSGLLAEIETSEALAALNYIQKVSVVTAMAAALLALGIGLGVTRWITGPIRQLTAVATAVMRGDYRQRVEIVSQNEIGQLAHAFNTMTGQLVQSITERNARIAEVEKLSATLEERVMDRTYRLELIATLSGHLSSILDLNALLKAMVNQVKDSFGYYHVHVYLLDEATGYLMMAEGSGYVGQQLKAKNHYLLADKGIVGLAATTRQYFVSNNVDEIANFIRNPLLPNTQSELAVPLLKGEQLLGVLDIQSDQYNRFSDEDISLMQSLANQTAIAIDNARLLSEKQATIVKLQELDRLKSEFLTSMSHELRTPLNAILGFSDVLLQGIDGPLNDYAQNDVQLIYNSGQHLLTLINDILDISKIEAGMMELVCEEVELISLLDELIASSMPLVGNKPLEIIAEYQANLPSVYADKIRLKQILLNLLSNAIKFTAQGQVKLKAELAEEFMQFMVIDSGIGIPLDKQQLVFERFKQADMSTTKLYGGTGLGLAICKQLVEMHGGKIGVRSEVGAGAEFWFTVPLTMVA